jgi:hypothetical protein
MNAIERQALIDMNHQQHVIAYYEPARVALRRATAAEKRLEAYERIHGMVCVVSFFAVPVAFVAFVAWMLR